MPGLRELIGAIVELNRRLHRCSARGLEQRRRSLSALARALPRADALLALGRQRFYQEAAERTAVPGVATGLAVTGTGGDVLFVEATRMNGSDGFTRITRPLPGAAPHRASGHPPGRKRGRPRSRVASERGGADRRTRDR